MGKQLKRVARATDRVVRIAVTSLVVRATRRAAAAPRAARSAMCEDLESEVFEEASFPGWSARLALRFHQVDPTYPSEQVEHWHLSMQLFPKGRADRPRDWEQLADLVSRIASKTGYTGAYVAAIRPLDEAPGNPHHFVWHGDNSPISPETRRALGRRIALMEATTR